MRIEDLVGLSQPDQRSCGPSSLVAARMLVDPAYRPASFAGEALALHRQVTASTAFGRTQLPWPRALGTPPWAAERAMESYTGVAYLTRVVRWGDRVADLAAIRVSLNADRPCPLFVGDRWLPRHVVLAVDSVEGGVRVYNPARGTLVDLPAEEFVSGDLTVFGRWVRPWFVVAQKGE